MDIHDLIVDVNNYIMAISIIVVNYIHNWIADVRKCIKDDWIMDP